MFKMDIFFAIVLVAIISIGGYKINSLSTELAQQQANIDRLNKFVGAQADVLTFCQNAMTELGEWIIEKNVFGKFESTPDILAKMGECNDAISEFNLIATEN